MKMMSIREFRDLGFVHEINRRLLHPCGLALVVEEDEGGRCRLLGIQDSRDDPEGMAFSEDLLSPEKAASVDAEMATRMKARSALFGALIQPVRRQSQRPTARARYMVAGPDPEAK